MSGTATRQMAVLRALGGGECLTVDRLAARVPLPRHALVQGAARLVSRGLVERVATGCFQITEAGREALASGAMLTSGPNGPLIQQVRCQVRTTLRERLWRALRIEASGGAVTVNDLLVNALAGGERDAASNAQKYLRALERTGYVHRLPRKDRRGQVRWRLARNTGPAAPMLQPDRNRVFDPNTGQGHEMAGEAP